MTASTPPTDNSGATGSPKAPEQRPGQTAVVPLPFYRRTWFWMLIGMLAGLAALLILFSCQKPEPQQQPQAEVPAAPPKDPDKDTRELLDVQRAQNEGLEEEIRRLQALLKEDPCAISGMLGQSPEAAPVAPGYENKPPAAPPAANGTSPLPAPGGNGTVPIPAAPSSAPAPATVSDLMDKATVFILSLHNEQVGMGSGFFVAPGIIATNRHVTQGPDAKVMVGNKSLGGMHPARIVAYSHNESRDYALLRVDDAVAAKAPVLRMTGGTSRTERVSAWGFPGYIAQIDPKLQELIKGDIKAVPEVVYSEGVVSVVLERQPAAILHTAAISQGNSGGPLINAQGVVVGINTFIRRADSSYSQTNIALPGGDLALFMKEHGVQASMVKE